MKLNVNMARNIWTVLLRQGPTVTLTWNMQSIKITMKLWTILDFTFCSALLYMVVCNLKASQKDVVQSVSPLKASLCLFYVMI